jgi:hypothetical protein
MSLPPDLPSPDIPSGIGRGWWPIVWKLHAALLELDPDYRISQIKEKFGGLRYYADFENVSWQDAEPLIAAAEKAASETCEVCGQPGRA